MKAEEAEDGDGEVGGSGLSAGLSAEMGGHEEGRAAASLLLPLLIAPEVRSMSGTAKAKAEGRMAHMRRLKVALVRLLRAGGTVASCGGAAEASAVRAGSEGRAGTEGEEVVGEGSSCATSACFSGGSMQPCSP